MKRRKFLADAGAAAGATALAGPEVFAKEPAKTQVVVNGMPRRVLGRTGATVSVVGFPGLLCRNHEQGEVNAGIRRAMERGLNYFDVAPAYGRDGEAEVEMGIGLQGIDRDSYFLSCKTKCDDAAGARFELEQSLSRLKTDHFDLYQLHCLQKREEVEQALGPGGAMDTILKARDEGKIKHIGFSAHTTEAALTALEGFEFDTCMFPINFVEWFRTGFGQEVVKRANEKGVALISIKPVSLGRWPEGMEKAYQWWYRPIQDPEQMKSAMRWVFSLPGLVTGIPASFLPVLDTMIDGVQDLEPVRGEDPESLEKFAANCTPLFNDKPPGVAMRTPHDRGVA